MPRTALIRGSGQFSHQQPPQMPTYLLRCQDSPENCISGCSLATVRAHTSYCLLPPVRFLCSGTSLASSGCPRHTWPCTAGNTELSEHRLPCGEGTGGLGATSRKRAYLPPRSHSPLGAGLGVAQSCTVWPEGWVTPPQSGTRHQALLLTPSTQFRALEGWKEAFG